MSGKKVNLCIWSSYTLLVVTCHHGHIVVRYHRPWAQPLICVICIHYYSYYMYTILLYTDLSHVFNVLKTNGFLLFCTYIILYISRVCVCVCVCHSRIWVNAKRVLHFLSPSGGGTFFRARDTGLHSLKSK